MRIIANIFIAILFLAGANGIAYAGEECSLPTDIKFLPVTEAPLNGNRERKTAQRINFHEIVNSIDGHGRHSFMQPTTKKAA